MANGCAMDCSVTAYLSVIPCILSIAEVWTARQWINTVWKIYFVAVSAMLAMIFTLDIVLYGYWGFRLDTTPLFYFISSPKAAIASASIPEIIGGLAAIVILTVSIYFLLSVKSQSAIRHKATRPVTLTIIISLVTLLLFIPIRGGVTVSTMNLSRAYFSNNPRLNHAAINPAFSLMYSAAHQDKFGDSFQYFDDSQARDIFASLHGDEAAVRDTSLTLTTSRPDVYIIILESFSAHLMPSLGGQPIAVKLDSIAASGAVWTNFYANSFRTDRSLPAILSGFPSQPTTSLMKYVEKAEKLPSLADQLKRHGGYESWYYYGGDANFTNMLAYLVSSSFDRVISDKDFPVSQRLSKWGAHDHVVFERVISELPDSESKPRFTVIQTSSSHEPFEVPYRNMRFADNDRANSLAYTDSCLAVMTNVINNHADRPSLIIMVPDHYGSWPTPGTLKYMPARHHIPLVMTGSAMSRGGLRYSTTGSQVDIAPTLLHLLGMDSSAFTFGYDLLDGKTSHYAWISEPEFIGLIGPDGKTAIYNIAADTVDPDYESPSSMIDCAKAYLQVLYMTIDSL